MNIPKGGKIGLNRRSGTGTGSGNITETFLEANYLKLDCSNDPLTGTLQTDERVDINGTYEYIIQEEF